ncbi:MAG: hypothetical protein LLG14_20360 [Nocardiaceae bacterium]|nr:hypothetical protein [Nocardiaceae bacterium]
MTPDDLAVLKHKGRVEYTIAYHAQTGVNVEVDDAHRHPWREHVETRLNEMRESDPHGWALCFVARREITAWEAVK